MPPFTSLTLRLKLHIKNISRSILSSGESGFISVKELKKPKLL